MKIPKESVIVFGLWFLLLIFMWWIRPLLFPRHGEWINDQYWMGDSRCGNIVDYTFRAEGYDGYADPPVWVGLPSFNQYRTRDAAVHAVEWSCQ